MWRGAALPGGAANWIQLISTGIFTLAGGSLAARRKLGPWANLRRRCCARFGTNLLAGKTVPCVKVPFWPSATVPLPLTNSTLCKRSSGNGAARPRCSKTMPCVKAAWCFKIIALLPGHGQNCDLIFARISLWTHICEMGPMVSNWPNSQIPQCTSPISHNAPFRTEMCTFLFWLVHCGIWTRCIVGFVRLVYCDDQ